MDVLSSPRACWDHKTVRGNPGHLCSMHTKPRGQPHVACHEFFFFKTNCQAQTRADRPNTAIRLTGSVRSIYIHTMLGSLVNASRIPLSRLPTYTYTYLRSEFKFPNTTILALFIINRSYNFPYQPLLEMQ